MISIQKLISRFAVPPGSKVNLAKDFDPGYKGEKVKKKEARQKLREGVELLAELQDKLYAQNRYALLIVFQAMDAAGKDSAIKHVMSGLNPQGTQVFSFKAPSAEELDHDYLWRCAKRLPERGRIGIFNRSYYEEVLVVRVHPEFLEKQNLPPECVGDDIWKRRFEQMNNFERYLTQNGIAIVKFFLHVSKEEQKKRFLQRIDRAEKNWKFSVQDVKERQLWDRYQHAYEQMLTHTSTKWAPWHVIPADHKWFTRLAVAAVVAERMQSLKLAYPELSDEERKKLQEMRAMLESEDSRKNTAGQAGRE